MASDHKSRLAFLAEKWSSENRTNRTGGAASVRPDALWINAVIGLLKKEVGSPSRVVGVPKVKYI